MFFRTIFCLSIFNSYKIERSVGRERAWLAEHHSGIWLFLNTFYLLLTFLISIWSLEMFRNKQNNNYAKSMTDIPSVPNSMFGTWTSFLELFSFSSVKYTIMILRIRIIRIKITIGIHQYSIGIHKYCPILSILINY